MVSLQSMIHHFPLFMQPLRFRMNGLDELVLEGGGNAKKLACQ